MKIKLLFILSIFSAVSGFAQFGSQQIISTEAQSVIRAIPYDVDEDGFEDIISMARLEGEIIWFKNLDGQGNFGGKQILGSNIPAILSLELFDLNGDGKKDILYSTNLDKIAWLENLGSGNFSPEKIIAQTDFAYTIEASDIEGDSDLDIVAVLYNGSFDDRLVWFENMDGEGNFGNETIIDTKNYYGPDGQDVATLDIDNDGDLDIIIAYAIAVNAPQKLVWYENNGQGNFENDQLIYQFEYLLSDGVNVNYIVPKDLNGDNFIDLIIDTSHDELQNNIYWMENLTGNVSFSEPKFIYEKGNLLLNSIRSYDLDFDGDNDILISLYNSSNSGSISWFKNTNAQGVFSSQQIISTEVERAMDATASDLDGDSKIDIISASSFDDKVAWYKNNTLGITENEFAKYKIYPNPTNGILHIKSRLPISQISVFNLLGQIIESKQNTNQIELSKAEAGIYLLMIEDENGNSQTHKIVKQ